MRRARPLLRRPGTPRTECWRLLIALALLGPFRGSQLSGLTVTCQNNLGVHPPFNVEGRGAPLSEPRGGSVHELDLVIGLALHHDGFHSAWLFRAGDDGEETKRHGRRSAALRTRGHGRSVAEPRWSCEGEVVDEDVTDRRGSPLDESGLRDSQAASALAR